MAVVNIAHPDLLGRITNYCSSWRRMTRVLARITRLGMSFYPTPCGNWKNGKRYYEVRWADSWEPEENLEGCADLISEFWKTAKSKGKAYKQVIFHCFII